MSIKKLTEFWEKSRTKEEMFETKSKIKHFIQMKFHDYESINIFERFSPNSVYLKFLIEIKLKTIPYWKIKIKLLGFNTESILFPHDRLANNWRYQISKSLEEQYPSKNSPNIKLISPGDMIECHEYEDDLNLFPKKKLLFCVENKEENIIFVDNTTGNRVEFDIDCPWFLTSRKFIQYIKY